MNKKRGQALVELVLSFHLLGFVLAGVVQMSHILLTRHQLQACAQLGASLLGSGLVSDEAVRQEMQRCGFEFTVGPYKETTASRFYDLVQSKVKAGPFLGRVMEERFVVHREVQ